MINKNIKRLLRFLLLGCVFILLLLIGTILFIRSPWGQSIIVQKASSYVSGKTKTTVDIGRLYITFSGNIQVERLFLNDTSGDTLIYSESLEASLAFAPLLFNQKITIDYVEWDGLKTKLNRTSESKDFNYNFLIDAFSTTKDTPSDSTSEPFAINIGQIHLSNIAIDYDDQWLGLKSKLLLKELFFEAKKIDFENLIFEIEALQIAGTSIDYLQTKPFAESNTPQTSTDSILPKIIINELSLNNIQVNYASVPDKIETHLNLGNFILNETEVDLDQQKIQLNRFLLDSSSMRLITLQELAEKENSSTTTPFKWPNWEIDIEEITLAENSFYLQSSEATMRSKSFNPKLIQLDKLQLVANDLHYLPDDLSASFQSFSFYEGNQFFLKNLAFNLALDENSLNISDLEFATTSNEVKGELSLEFASFEKLLAKQEIQKLKVDLPLLIINPKDLFYFLPELKKNNYVTSLSKDNLRGQLELEGNLDKLVVPNVMLKWGQSKLATKGVFLHLKDFKELEFSLDTFDITSSQKDILTFIEQEEVGIEVPQQIHLFGKTSGKLDDLSANATLKIPEGEIKIDGAFANSKQIVFDGKLALNKLELGKLLDNPKIGVVSLRLSAKGNGKDLSSLNAIIRSEVDQLQLNNYDYSALKLDGAIQNGKGTINATFNDYNLNAKLNVEFSLDTLKSFIDADFDVIGADLNALGFTEKQLKMALQLGLHFEGNEDKFEFNSTVNNAIIVSENQPYSLESITINAKSDLDTSIAKVTSDFLNLELNSNAPYSDLLSALESQFMYYFSDEKVDSSAKDVRMNLNLTVKETPLITEIFSDEVRYDSIQLNLNFNHISHQLNALLIAPAISYQESNIDSILFSINGDKQDLQFSLGFSNFNSGPLNIPQTSFEGEFKDKTAFINFIISDQKEKLMQIKSEIQPTDSQIVYHINPEGLLLNKNPWIILPNNELRLSQRAIIAKDFELSRNENKLRVESSTVQNGRDVIELIFENFQLSTLTTFLNTEDTIASGIIKGNLAIENPMNEIGLVSNLQISQFELLDIALGKLQLNATSQNNEQYKLDLSLKGSSVDLDLNGAYTAKKTEGLLDFDFNLNRLEIAAIENFSSEYLTDLKGTISASATLTGTIENPTYNGAVDFRNTSSTVNALNAPFKLPDESINFTTNEIVFNNFLIQDSHNNSFRLDGKILTKSLLNPEFDLTLKAKQFQLLNSTIEDNELFFGKLSLNKDLSIKGNLNIPVIRGKLEINENSNLTYIVPEEELDLMERDGIIVFVNKKNPDAILTRNEENESVAAVIKGYDLNTTLKVDKNVDFKIIVDQRSGDNLKIKGNGDFKFGLEPNGRTTLSGRYEVQDGFYEASLYNIVKRKFDIAKGSSIVWRGNPLDAEMDIRAIYKIETSASGLMASKTSSQGVGIANEYRQKLPFLVYLNLDGELLKPQISFQLDMPESSKGQLGGQVYTRVQQLNAQEEELNKQVFSLLVLNQFFPTTSNDGTGGGSAAIARGNVNKVLEDQLNNFSGKYLGDTGLELDFGVDSYTDYQGEAPSNKTQLDVNARKKLFNDKLVVQVGSGVSIEENSGSNQQNTPVVGNVSLEYLFSENGRWRVKGFRKNEFESVIEGQLIVTGISLIFQREFNRFRELAEEMKKQKESSTEPEQ